MYRNKTCVCFIDAMRVLKICLILFLIVVNMACRVNCNVKAKFHQLLLNHEGVAYGKRLEEEFKNGQLKRYHDDLFSSRTVTELLEKVGEFRENPETAWVVKFRPPTTDRRYEHEIDLQSEATNPPLILGLGMQMRVQFDDECESYFYAEPGELITVFPSKEYTRWSIKAVHEIPSFLLVNTKPKKGERFCIQWSLYRL